MFEKLIRKACEALAKQLPKRIITRSDFETEVYLERYYVLGKRPSYLGSEFRTRFEWLPTLLLHHFLRSDDDLELHNHPWKKSVSFILAGGYIEERALRAFVKGAPEIVTRIIRPFSFNIIRANDFHRVDLIEEDCWTFFMTGEKAQSWGFLDRNTGKFLSWREHLALRNQQAHLSYS